MHIIKVDAVYYRVVSILAFLMGVCAVTSMIGGFIWLSCGGKFVGTGFWFDTQIILTAILGITARRKKSKRVMFWFFCMSLTSVLVCVAQIAIIGYLVQVREEFILVGSSDEKTKINSITMKLLSNVLALFLAFYGSALAHVVAFGKEEETDPESTQRLIDFEFQYDKL